MKQERVELEMGRLLDAGKLERPSRSLLDRTLTRLEEASTAPGPVARPGWWGSLVRAWPRLVAPLALAATACLAWLSIRGLEQPSGPPARLKAEANLRPERWQHERANPELLTSAPLEPTAKSAPAPPASAVEPVASSVPSPRGSVVAQRRASRPRLPGAAELAARQRLASDQRDFAAAAARALGDRRNERGCAPASCTIVRPTDPLISDFEDVSDEGVFVDGDAFSEKPGDWWQKFYGSPYVFPNVSLPDSGGSGLSQTVQGRWHVRGLVKTWSGFGLWLGACMVDFSEYRGLSFELWGQAGPSGAVTLHVDTHDDTPPETCRSNVGRCSTEHGACEAPSKRLEVPQTPGRTTVVLWEELTGGAPRNTPDPAAIVQWHWSFDWAAEDAPYPVDVWVDNVRLVR